MRLRLVLPLPRFVLHPLTAGTIAAVHVYLAYGHLAKLIGGEAEWVHIWKGFGASFGAYVFTALASRRHTKSPEGTIRKENDTEDFNRVSEPLCHVNNTVTIGTF
jgi:hypothetical protein